MLSIILKAFPWQTLFGIFSKLILHFIDKNEEKVEAKKAFLRFLDEVKNDVPVRLNKNYRDQVRALKQELKDEWVKKQLMEDQAHNYKEAYEELRRESHGDRPDN